MSYNTLVTPTLVIGDHDKASFKEELKNNFKQKKSLIKIEERTSLILPVVSLPELVTSIPVFPTH